MGCQVGEGGQMILASRFCLSDNESYRFLIVVKHLWADLIIGDCLEL